MNGFPADVAAEAVIQTAEARVLQDPRYPTAASSFSAVTVAPQPPPQYVLNPDSDRSILLDHHGRPVTVDRMLATKPLRNELLTRPGPGGRKLIYLAGESVTRTLNDVFGFDGWHLTIVKTEKTVCTQEEGKQRSNNGSNSKHWHVAYTAHVRITHRQSGTYKEDLGAGDALDKHLPTAVQHALKASITDALKRAARHFGDKLGNSLYQGNFNLQSAPKTLADALDQLDKERAQTKFGKSNSTKTPVAMGKPAAAAVVVQKMPPPPPPPSRQNASSAVVVAASNLHQQPSTKNVAFVPPPPPPVASNNNKNKRPILNGSNIIINGAPAVSSQHQPSTTTSTTAAATTTPKYLTSASAQQQQHPRPPLSTASVNTTATTSTTQPPPPTAAQGLHGGMFAASNDNNDDDDDEVDWSLVRPETATGRRTTPRLLTSSTTQQQQPPASKKQKVNPYNSV